MTSSWDGVEVQCWDSNLFISFLTNTEPEKAEIVRDLLQQAQAARPRIRIVISNLVIAEVRPSSAVSPERLAVIDELFDTDRPYIQFFAVTRAIAQRAREIGIQFPGLSGADTVHLATALTAGADVFFTFDGDRVKGRRRPEDLLRYDRQIGDPPLRIERPWVNYGPLFQQQRG